MEKTKKYVAYLRVSTQRQGVSGLGLEAQRQMIKSHLRDHPLEDEFVEVESGRKNNRPKLKEALEKCRKTGAVLIVAKLDRLARNVCFLSQLLESDVEIIFCDFPQANKMMLHILSAISQYEAELISSRTRSALQAKKARGFKLGNPNHLMDNHHEAIRKSNKTNSNKAKANPNNKRAIAMLKVLCQREMTLQGMADELNDQGFTTSQGHRFSASTIFKLIKRYQLKN